MDNNTTDASLDRLVQEARDPHCPPRRLRYLAAQDDHLARAAACNPGAPVDLLRDLARKSDPEVRRGGAANPNTPADLLPELAIEFPDEVLSNPVFPLLLIEKPDLLYSYPVLALKRMLSCEEMPGPLARQLTTHVDPLVSELAQLHVQLQPRPDSPDPLWLSHTTARHSAGMECSSEQVDQWLTSPDRLLDALLTVFHRTQSLRVVPPEVSLLIMAAEDPELRRWNAAATRSNPSGGRERPGIPNHGVEQGEVHIEPPEERAGVEAMAMPKVVCTQPGTIGYENQVVPAGAIVVERRGRHYSFAVPQPACVLERLASHRSEWVRRSVAEAPDAPPAALEKLARDISAGVRLACVQHPLLQPRLRREILSRAILENDMLRGYLLHAVGLAHPLAALAALTEGASSPEWLTRLVVAVHPRTPDPVRRRLAHDGIWLVQAAARRVLARSGDEWDPNE